MKAIACLLVVLIVLVACSTSEPAAEDTPMPLTATTSPAQEPAAADWPENFSLCRPVEDDASGRSDCWQLNSAEEWLELGPVIGDEIWVWPEGMPLPPLPDGMVWLREHDDSIGEYYWIIIAAEE